VSESSELDRIDPEPVQITLSTGYTVVIQRLKTRQFFRLLKVLTRGLGPVMIQAQLDFGGDPEEFSRKLMSMLVLAIPEAEQPFIEFLQSMALPPGIHEATGGQRLSREELQENQDMLSELVEELNNPELEDLIDIAEAIIRQEAPEIQALGKKARGWMEVARKAGLLSREEQPPPQPRPSQARSQRRSISSVTNTDGPTKTSSASPSAGSGSASRRQRPAASTSTSAG
jgi:hypothetical protein